jgi:release factor glutamine methyltransferase
MAHALRVSRTALVTQAREAVNAQDNARYRALVARRLAGEPIAYLVGRREFYGREFAVTPAALIPRPETELLVELSLARLEPACHGHVLDLGTGSGIVAVTLALERCAAHVTAVDVSEAALELARANAATLGARVQFVRSDWYASLAAQRYHLIVANPPYVAAGDVHLTQGDLRFEPVGALTDHADGLTALRAIIAGGRRWLSPGAWLLVEHGYDQAAAVAALFEAAGYIEATCWRDLAGVERASGARAPG